MRLLLLAACGWTALAHDPVTTRLTWSAEISRIVYRRCAGCHRDGGKTPMSLLDYEQVRPWAKAMRDEVLARRMPPWGAVKGYGDFQGDISLSQDEINRIAEWVEGGAPEGDSRLLPPKPPSVSTGPAAARGRRLRGPVRLPRAAQVLAISPFGDIPTAKIYARKPDGSVEPMLWLLGYQGKWNRSYVYEKPMLLPAGTVMEANPPVPFDVIVPAKLRKPAH